MNTEIFMIKEIKNYIEPSTKYYTNKITGFVGTYEDAIKYAEKHNYGGGVKIIEVKKTKNRKGI
jgi:hypothetical protein